MTMEGRAPRPSSRTKTPGASIVFCFGEDYFLGLKSSDAEFMQ